MLNIDRMQIHLPAGYEHRATFIARMVGDAMADYQPGESRRLDRLSIGPIQISANATDRDIANNIVERITLMLGEAI